MVRTKRSRRSYSAGEWGRNRVRRPDRTVTGTPAKRDPSQRSEEECRFLAARHLHAFPDPQEVVSSLLRQRKQGAPFRPSKAEERHLGYNATMLALLGHTFQAHDFQSQQEVRHLVDNIASELTEMVSGEKRGVSRDAYVLGILEALAGASSLLGTLLRRG